MRIFAVLALAAIASLAFVATSVEFDHSASVADSDGRTQADDLRRGDSDLTLAKSESRTRIETDPRLGPKITLMKFGATWCPPCRKMDLELTKLRREGLPVFVRKIDVDQNSRLASKYEVSSIPRLILLADGEIIGDRTGYMSADQLRDWIEEEAPFGWQAGGETQTVRKSGMQSNPFFQ